jgi:peptidylprolyl isomerase
MRLAKILLAASVAAVLAGCGAATETPQKTPAPSTVVTASGLQYQNLKYGTGYACSAGDIVDVDYIAYLQDGNVKFESTLDPGGKPLEFAPGRSETISGLEEGVSGMRVGGERRLIIPPDLGYGATGKTPLVPANAVLIYYVKLVQVKPLVTTASGLQYIDLSVGAGATPKAGDTLVVNYTGWLLDNTKFDSSLDPGRTPFEFTIGQDPPAVIGGWEEGLLTMNVGGKRKLIVPPALAYGEAGQGDIPPNSTLIFDIELLQIK